MWVGLGDRDSMHVLSGVITVLAFLRGITYFRLFESTRYMIDLIQEVLVDMLGFFRSLPTPS